ncbi:molybdenum cofactor biosynthesis protein MoaE [Salibacterium salarium]|uniref:Molybdopterin synthase catalytic subunit n=1 Tax=Salibacterium salarium TaxID=284579 RepID=A0A3R9P9V4_9BACI|nr:molybdenum cofactor biosynthesis protein MoaE [Salibacterium salarium]RSL33622.1 molybdenum cofactor biosynthesis protein MoaE [Salibacterium salarium]
MTETYFELTEQPILTESVIEKVKRREAGAITTFIGTVREFTNEKRTLKLEYQAYVSMAEKKLSDIGDEVQEKWPDAIIAITHRIGTLHISDAAVVIAVSSPHRKTAYEANEYIIHRIKEVVPIWKKEFWEDGTSWVGDQLETTPYPEGAPWKGDSHD